MKITCKENFVQYQTGKTYVLSEFDEKYLLFKIDVGESWFNWVNRSELLYFFDITEEELDKYVNKILIFK